MKNLKFSKLKYPLYLFLFILIAKVGYVVVESYYNYHVLTVTTSPSLSKEAVEELNLNGHRISALGITLLLIPFLYLLVKKLKTKKMISYLIGLSIFTYLLSFQTLNIIVDEIVETNKEKRHDAYYVNIFKYGILNNIFTYNSFIDNSKIINNNIDVNDRILLTNSFLLLYADKKLIAKLKERGKDKVADLYIDRELKDDYTMKFKAFKEASTNISELWNKLNENRKKLKNQLSKLEENEMKKSYSKLVSNLKLNYTKYKTGWQKITNILEKETAPYKIRATQRDLNKYFRYQKYTKAQKQYKISMNNKFGHYIEPTRWKDSNNRVTKEQIELVITQEIMKTATKELGNMPQGLSALEFMYNDDTRLAVMKKLKENDILIPYEFNYSYKQYKKYFEIMANKTRKKAYNLFYTTLEKELGQNDLTLDMTWNKFIYSNYIKNRIKLKLNTTNKEDLNNMLLALKSKDLANFRKIIYLPKIKDKVNQMMYKKDDFFDGNIAELKGDDAIKLLYIPPFALSVSIIALLLNLFTVFTMLLAITPIPKKISLWLKISFIIIIISLPIISSYNKLENKLIKQSSTDKTKTYLNFLNWISYYEKLNSNFHKI